MKNPPHSVVPNVFLSYASENRDTAERIANGLNAAGIETFWAEWEMRAGDRLREKIEGGLASCTHFIVLLTPESIRKEWVNAEIDAAFILKMQNRCRLIPLRCGIPPAELPPLLAPLFSPQIDALARDLQPLINDIYGISRRPPRGSPPPIVALHSDTGYSPAANAVAKFFIESSEHGMYGDPQIDFSALMDKTSLKREELIDALHALGSLVKDRQGSGRRVISPMPELFSVFDRFWKEWDPRQDALRLAADLVNDKDFPVTLHVIAERYKWPARRLNPAAAYLMSQQIVEIREMPGGLPFVGFQLRTSDATRRFVQGQGP